MSNAEIIATDPGWIILVKGLLVFATCVVLTLLAIWAERRIVARMQERPGPNRVGPLGLLQSLSDGVKLALKEDLIPAAADKVIFVLAPIISATTCFMAFAVIPVTGAVSLFGHETVMQMTDIPVGVLYVLAVASVGVYGIVLAGWSSGSTYPLLGGLRSSAQVISYEVAMGLSLVSVFIYAGSMSTSEIVAAQSQWWFAVVLFPSFVIYAISMVGETNRAPFDLAEAEGELVGGFHTEYSSLKFALFFLAEYVNIVAVSALATTLFLGGYHAPPGLGFTEAWLGGWFTAWWLVHSYLVLCKGCRVLLLVRVVARNSSTYALRPIHAIWLESSHSSFTILDLNCCNTSLAFTTRNFTHRLINLLRNCRCNRHVHKCGN